MATNEFDPKSGSVLPELSPAANDSESGPVFPKPGPASSSAKGVVILGATSALARAIAIEFARHGYDLVMAARDQDENELIAQDLRVRFGVCVTPLPFEAETFESHAMFFDLARNALGDGMAGVVVCFGWLEDQALAEKDFAVARRTIDVNLTAAVSMLELFAKHFEESGPVFPKPAPELQTVLPAKGAGFGKTGPPFIAALSSVAGDRGRPSNYMYGAAKAGLSAYLQGLRGRLFKSNVPVITIKPGFVDTKMTFGKPNLFLVAAPENAGRAIYKAIQKRRNVAYVPWFWRYIMLIVIHVPETVFKRMKKM